MLESDRYSDVVSRMKNLINPLENYKHYRAMSHEMPCIPALGMLLLLLLTRAMECDDDDSNSFALARWPARYEKQRYSCVI
jgi:hypothetical protein